MAVAITTSADPTYARIRVTVTGATATEVTVTRTGSDNVVVPVRSADPLYPIGGNAEVFDYEAEFNAPVVYTVTDGVTVLNSSPVTLSVGISWLKSPSQPTLNIPVRFQRYPELSRSRPVGVHRVLGRSTPVVATGTMSSFSGSLDLLSGNEDASDALSDLLTQSERVYLQAPSSRLGNRYFAVTGYKESPFTRYLFEDSFLWSIDVVEVDRPDGDLIGNPTATYDGLRTGVATYTALKTGYASYRIVTRGVGAVIAPPNPGGF